MLLGMSVVVAMALVMYCVTVVTCAKVRTGREAARPRREIGRNIISCTIFYSWREVGQYGMRQWNGECETKCEGRDRMKYLWWCCSGWETPTSLLTRWRETRRHGKDHGDKDDDIPEIEDCFQGRKPTTPSFPWCRS